MWIHSFYGPIVPPLSSWRQRHDQHITHLQSVANFCYHVIHLCFLNFKTQYWVLSCWFLKQSLELLTTLFHEYEQHHTRFRNFTNSLANRNKYCFIHCQNIQYFFWLDKYIILENSEFVNACTEHLIFLSKKNM